MHQHPQVHHTGTRLLTEAVGDSPDEIMRPGLAFTIEPIITMCETTDQLCMGKDRFSIVAPGIPSCQWEHTVLITETGCEVLTKRPDERIF